jgi:adenylate cyclase
MIMALTAELLVHELTPLGKVYACTKEILDTTELGRQENDREVLYTRAWYEPAQRWRLVIARLDEQTIGRHHLVIELLAGGRVRLTNTSSMSTVRLENGIALAKNEPCVLPLSAAPLVVFLGSTRVVHLQQAAAPENDLAELPHATMPPEDAFAPQSRFVPLAIRSDPGIAGEALVSWLQSALQLLQHAVNSTEFFIKAAQGVVDMAGMDSGRVLILEQGSWQVRAEASKIVLQAAPRSNWQPSQQVLTRMVSKKKTLWELPKLDKPGSLMGIQAVIAAPILDPSGEVIGALYGDRRQDGGRAITNVEAMLVELLACGVAAGLARAKQELAALRFEQFFTPQLARYLAQHPDMLRGQQKQVTILFCDVRRFSYFSELLGPVKTIEWISDVMAELSDCVIQHEGVLVDYIGDELMAMWGAPEDQPGHASLACRAGLAMLEKLAVLNARWQPTLEEPMGFGIGVNSGQAHVGNTGSPRKFKYGALGNTVNVASRVQGATKHVRAELLITEDTFDALDPALRSRARQLCTVRVVNINQPLTLYQLAVSPQSAAPDWKRAYEQALAEFTAEKYRDAARTLAPLYFEHVNDGPSIVLLSRAVQALANGPSPGHPVWDLPTK